jgi:hypothetical protein
MSPAELFELISSALAPLELDQSRERDQRIYLAYLASRIGQGQNGPLERRLAQLRQELGL